MDGILGADIGRALCMFALLAVQSKSSLALAFPIVFLFTCLDSLFSPALSSVLPSVVPEDPAADTAQKTRVQSVITRDVAAGLTVVGIPANPLKRREKTNTPTAVAVVAQKSDIE